MKIREIRAMRGPNYWSIRRHFLIVMKLDLEEMEERPSNLIEGFSERLEKMFPTMYEHECSEGHPEAFSSVSLMEPGWGMWLNILLWKFKHLPEWM
jgi:cyanophycin synthetase